MVTERTADPLRRRARRTVNTQRSSACCGSRARLFFVTLGASGYNRLGQTEPTVGRSPADALTLINKVSVGQPLPTRSRGVPIPGRATCEVPARRCDDRRGTRVGCLPGFTGTGKRPFDEGMTRGFFERVKLLAKRQGLVSNEHFSNNGPLVETWAAHKRSPPPCCASARVAHGPWAQRRSRLSRQAPRHQCPCLHHPTRRPAPAQTRQHPRHALPQAPCSHGKPQRVDGRGRDHPGHRHRRA